MIGRYRLDGELGRGGMGIVYAAHDTQQGRDVALKVIAPEIGGDGGFAARFQREARIAVSFEHPHVVPVYEIGEDGGALFIAMRRVYGEDLGKVVRSEGALELSRIVRLARQIAGALDAAHARGLVHRDVKPGNVLLTGSGEDEHAYLTDFGLAREAASDTGLTNTGQWMGTADYVAPEQIEGGTVSARTDVYSLGCVLFELLTGDVPFTGLLIRKLFAHSKDALPSIGDVAGPHSGRIDQVLARATQKDPAHRFLSTGDLSRALAAAAAGRPAPSSEQSVATGAALIGLLTDAVGPPAQPRRGAAGQPPTRRAEPEAPTTDLPPEAAQGPPPAAAQGPPPAAAQGPPPAAAHGPPRAPTPEPTRQRRIPADPPPQPPPRKPQVRILLIAMLVTTSVLGVGFVVTSNLPQGGGGEVGDASPGPGTGTTVGTGTGGSPPAAVPPPPPPPPVSAGSPPPPPSSVAAVPPNRPPPVSSDPRAPPAAVTPPPPPPPPPPAAVSDDWPDIAAYTTILASERSKAAARRRAAPARASGLSGGLLYSSNYARLRPGYWVVFSGVMPSKTEADARTRRARQLGYSDAYTRCVSQGPGCG